MKLFGRDIASLGAAPESKTIEYLLAGTSRRSIFARHLNQEAAKTMRYGGAIEQEALQMIPLNAVWIIGVEDRVGMSKKSGTLSAGLSAFGLIPRATLEIPTSQRRLERILKLIEDCRYSIHDLSRIPKPLERCRT